MLDIAITLLDKNRCVWLGLQRSTGGVAYDYILKPAADIAPKISSPPKEKPLTHNEIFEKLQKAEARRQVGKFKGVECFVFSHPSSTITVNVDLCIRELWTEILL